jgi:uncharacterized pyridoxal phosphate-containing UPF0001 family protein
MASSVRENLAKVLTRIEEATRAAARSPESVTLVAATKTQSIETIADYVAACNEFGIAAVCGENYAQELDAKALALPHVEWHFIGRLQRNKVSVVYNSCRMIQSVDSERLLDTLIKNTSSERRGADFLLQVNISRDSAKGGFLPEDFTPPFIERLRTSAKQPRGLMTILQFGLGEDAQLKQYSELRALAERLEGESVFGKGWTADGSRLDRRAAIGRPSVPNGGPLPVELSMGMSEDFDVAIRSGATIVRVGSAIFGPRLT